MNQYKLLMKERDKQAKKMYQKLSNKEIEYADFNTILVYTDVKWKELIPILDSFDANNVCDKVWDIIHYIRSYSVLQIKDEIRLYTYLNYLEEFIDNSLIQNTEIMTRYSYAREFLHEYESDTKMVIIAD